MSDNLKAHIQGLRTEALIDFALEHLGAEDEDLRKMALQEHWARVKDAPGTLSAPVGDLQILRSQISRLLSTPST